MFSGARRHHVCPGGGAPVGYRAETEVLPRGSSPRATVARRGTRRRGVPARRRLSLAGARRPSSARAELAVARRRRDPARCRRSRSAVVDAGGDQPQARAPPAPAPQRLRGPDDADGGDVPAPRARAARWCAPSNRRWPASGRARTPGTPVRSAGSDSRYGAG